MVSTLWFCHLFIGGVKRPSLDYFRWQVVPIPYCTRDGRRVTSCVQTDLTLEGLQQIEAGNRSRMLEANEKAAVENKIYHFQTYVDDPDKVPFYTGLPNLGVLKLVFDMVESQISGSSKTVTKEEECFICLVKLRLNYLFKDIAYHLSPVKRICVFEHSVMINFNCACPAIQRGKGSGFLSEGSS